MAPMTFLMQSVTPTAPAFAEPTGLFVVLGALAVAGVLGVCAKIALDTKAEPEARLANAGRPVRVVPRLAA